MRHKALYPGILVLIVFAITSVFLIVPRLGTHAQSTAGCCGTNPPTAPRELDFPYYSLRDGFTSTLNLVSDSPKPLDFILALHSLAGEALLGSSMTIQPSAKLPIDLAGLISSLGADPTGPFGEGSISIYFSGTIMPLVGQVSMTNPSLHLSQEAEMVENDPGRTDIPSVLSGAWWGLAGGRDARIMVANMSGNLVTADVFLDFGGQRRQSSPLVFNPNETKVISIAQLLADSNASPSQVPEGGITIVQRGLKPSLVAQGRVTDPVTGFSTTLEFPDPARQPTSALHAVGLPIGTPPTGTPYAAAGSFTPHVIARNLLNHSQTMTVTVEYPKGATWNSTNWPGGPSNPIVRYAGALQEGQKNPNEALDHPPTPDPSTLTGQFTLAPVTVGAYDTVDDSLTAVMNQLPSPIAFCSIRIQYSGAPGTMIAQVSSVDAKQDLVVDARTMNEGDGWAGSGANPWHVDSQTQSVLFLTDESDQPARIGFSVTAGGVHYYLTELSLGPHETRAIDLRKLRDGQGADFKQNKIPTGASDGSVNWVRLDNVPVAGRVVVFTKKSGTASSYDCCTTNCTASLTDIGFNPTHMILGLGATQQCAVYADFYDCNSVDYPRDETASASWSSSNTSIMTVSSSGVVQGVGAGTANVNASYFGSTYDCANLCQASHTTVSNSSNIVVIKVGCSNLHLALGTGTPGAPTGTNSGTCTVTGTPSGGTYSWTSNKTTLTLAGTANATVTYTSNGPSSTMGDTVLTVKYTLNGQSGQASSTGITVHKPTSLQVVSGSYQSGGQTFTVSNTGSFACSDAYGKTTNTYGSGTTSYTGYLYVRTYSVLDQLSPANQFNNVGISKANITESFTSFSSTCCNPAPTGSITITTTIFGDRFGLGSTCCLSGEPGCSDSETQTITVNGYPVRTVAVSHTCSGVTLNP
ncbi:MAG TPA: Ig-like domain-containing protein [Terriglobia bacterium]|nr:Ig-like domain-containing protein [Terriglobia bacterium]